jgi:hypothetical protein
MWKFYKENGELKIRNVGYVQFLSATIGKGTLLPYLIDVAQCNYFSTFLQMLNKIIQELETKTVALK